MKVGEEYYYYQNDHLGTPQKMTAGNGEVVWSAKYNSFGEANIEVETIENNLQFAGQYEDAETGLHYNWYRYYDTNIGRYIKNDPLQFDGGDVNLYSYVWNNPLSLIDPEGLKARDFIDSIRELDQQNRGRQELRKRLKRMKACELRALRTAKIWVCKSDLGGDGTGIRFGNISHTYIVCQDPKKHPRTDEKFGKHPTAWYFILWGPGVVKREVNRDITKADCKRKRVTPEDKKRMCRPGDTDQNYNLPANNCHTWGNCKSQ
ncbi:MAG: RHS domain-containing protein [Desulfobacteraceae bacterium]|nr:RHS domain-containing protein [Desulfobacteraceae bacterium]